MILAPHNHTEMVRLALAYRQACGAFDWHTIGLPAQQELQGVKLTEQQYDEWRIERAKLEGVRNEMMYQLAHHAEACF